MRVSQRPLFF